MPDRQEELSRRRIEAMQAMLREGGPSYLAHYGLAVEYAKLRQHEPCREHLQAALQLDPGQTGAWKLLGKALSELDRRDEAIDAYTRGIDTARAKGDLQAMKEMQVFLKRLRKRPE